MSMEMEFVVTWGGTIIGTVLMTLLGFWIYKKANERVKYIHLYEKLIRKGE